MRVHKLALSLLPVQNSNQQHLSQGWALTGIAPYGGWSELAATNAPVADEPVEAVFRMNENPILPARIFFFHLFSTPKFSPLLPTTYQPLPPHSIARAPGSRDVERERAWSLEPAWSGSELGAWNELAAWSLERLEPDPHMTQVSIF
jgi:hypothetical protein